MVLVHRQIDRLADLAAAAGVDDLGGGIFLSDRPAERDRAVAVDIDIEARIGHRDLAADLRRQMKDIVLALHQMVQQLPVADVALDEEELIVDLCDVGGIPAVGSETSVEQGHLCPLAHQALGQIAADKAKAAGDQHLPAGQL